MTRVPARPSPELRPQEDPEKRGLRGPGPANSTSPHPSPEWPLGRFATLAKSLPFSEPGRSLQREKQLTPEALWPGAQRPAFVLALHPLRKTGGRTHGPPRDPLLTPRILFARLLAPSRAGSPAEKPGRPKGESWGGGTRDGGREEGEEGVEASADRGGLLVHYKITKNKWKTIKGFKSK